MYHVVVPDHRDPRRHLLDMPQAQGYTFALGGFRACERISLFYGTPGCRILKDAYMCVCACVSQCVSVCLCACVCVRVCVCVVCVCERETAVFECVRVYVGGWVGGCVNV